jgi:AraC family transcriptional regulator
MTWLVSLQQTLDTIESRLEQDISIEELAQQAWMSMFHFQRTFSLVLGIGIGEYIRYRRLSVAGEQLVAKQLKVIDAALIYGYDSPESFTRAFRKFHGINPSSAAKSPSSLRRFQPMKIKISIEGGNMMNVRIEEKGAFKIAGVKWTLDINDPNNHQNISQHWTVFNRSDKPARFCAQSSHDPIFKGNFLGVCVDNKDQKTFDYWIASSVSDDQSSDFETLDVESGLWAVFESVGAMPDAIVKLWKQIYREFFPTSAYQPKNTIDFEVYPSGDTASADYKCEVWIAVDKIK